MAKNIPEEGNGQQGDCVGFHMASLSPRELGQQGSAVSSLGLHLGALKKLSCIQKAEGSLESTQEDGLRDRVVDPVGSQPGPPTAHTPPLPCVPQRGRAWPSS